MSTLRSHFPWSIVLRWLPVLIFILALIIRIMPGARTIDDAFITFRYVRNILAGNGFVYNPGEHVLGTTTPLYTFLLSALGAFTGGAEAQFPQIALLVNAVADGLTCVLLFYLGRRLGSLVGGIGAALVWAIAPFSVTFAIGGLETSVYVLIITALVAAYLGGWQILAAFLAALAVLTRPDALILVGPLALDRILEVTGWGSRLKLPPRQASQPGRNQLILETLVFCLPLLIWGGFATAYFGSPLPHSITAKSVAYLLPPDAAFTRLLQHYSVPFMGSERLGTWWIGLGMLLFPFLFLVGALHAARRQPHAWPYLAYPWLYFATFSIANPLIFRWYLTPPLPAYLLSILIGADRLLYVVYKGKASPQSSEKDGNGNSIWRDAAYRLTAGLFVIIAPLILLSQEWTRKPDHGLARPAPGMAWYQLELLYRQAAESLADDLSAQSSSPLLAAGDVGVLGYYTGMRILDTVGLNSPQSTRYYPLDPGKYAINYAIPSELILDEQPEYIVILEVYGRNTLLPDPRFQRAYALRKKIPTDIYGSNGMLIFERK